MTMSKTLSLSILSSYCWLSKDSLKNTNLPPSSLKIFDVEDIVLNQIPPIKRRRLKGLSKMAMHTSLSCLDKVNFSADEVYTVFASQHGEIGRTTSIVNDIVDGNDISPKDFSLSVHNSSLGLFSIFNKNKHFGTSIAAGSNTFGFALLESYNLLKRNPKQTVLLTCFDLEVDQPFGRLQQRKYPSYSLSLLLSLNKANAQDISFSFERSDIEQSSHQPLAIAFFEFLQGEITAAQLSSADYHWKFNKHAPSA
ncbi:hypothetical protein TQ33_2211 [Kangiella geojedonensis]|uniref:Beta-ketoacyl synthase-like N-terminal domain-containing protein n=2 Tax=Kangiella geojedonensis TaxID=914150 RepID=A0A0F6TSL1_9GAMM|nr:hypothetical protein TQ33_2211 [Kangiella geojedonensis]